MALLEFPEFSVGSTVHQHSQIDALVNYYSTFNSSAKGGTQKHRYKDAANVIGNMSGWSIEPAY